jgi:hypothetical protein
MSQRNFIPAMCFGLGFAGSVAVSCGDPVEDCERPDPPEQPLLQGTLTMDGARDDALGAPLPAPGIEGGSLVLTDSELTMTYTNDGSTYTVRYAIAQSGFQ